MKSGIIYHSRSSEYFTPERCHILEITGSEEDPDLSLARARVEPGVTTAWHRLNGVDERYVVLEGRGRMEMAEAGNPSAVSANDVGPGDVVLIPRGAPQRIANTGDADLVFLCLCTPPFVTECYEDLDTDMAATIDDD